MVWMLYLWYGCYTNLGLQIKTLKSKSVGGLANVRFGFSKHPRTSYYAYRRIGVLICKEIRSNFQVLSIRVK